MSFLRDTQTALAAYEKAVVFDPGDSEGWRYLGELQYRVGNLAAAEKSFSVLKRFPDDRSRSMGCARLNWIYHVRGDLSAAEKITREALRLAERAQWPEGMARAYGYLGVIHETRGELDQAEAMQQQSLSISKALGHTERIATVYRNLGIIFLKRHDLDRAEEMLLMSLQLYGTFGAKWGVAATYGILGVIYRLRHDLKAAETMQLKSLTLSQALEYKEGIAITQRDLAEIYHARNDRERMRDCGGKSRDLWRDIGVEEKAAKVEDWLRDNGCNA